MDEVIGVVITLLNQTLTLLPERALFWHEERLLVVGDLHWGKTEIFQQAGIPLPGGVLRGDLERLARAIEITGAKGVLLLGDLIHHARGISSEVNEMIVNWRKEHPLPMELVEGNHDRGIKPFLETWQITLKSDEKRMAPFIFRHIPIPPEPNQYIWSGHLHPTVRLGKGLRFPCFDVGERQGCLPAFSFFTGGQNIQRQPGSRYFAVVDETVLEV